MIGMHGRYDRIRSRLGRRFLALDALVVVLTMSTACSDSTPPPASSPATAAASPVVAALNTKIARFAPVPITADATALPPNEREALDQLVRAARLVDGLFLEQVWAGNAAALAHLASDRTPEGQAELHYFLINKGPWSRLDHNENFLRPGIDVPAKPPQANFYPADA